MVGVYGLLENDYVHGFALGMGLSITIIIKYVIMVKIEKGKEEIRVNRNNWKLIKPKLEGEK